MPLFYVVFSCFGYFFNNIVHSNTSSQPYSPIVHFTFVQDKFNFSIVQNPKLNLVLILYFYIFLFYAFLARNNRYTVLIMFVIIHICS